MGWVSWASEVLLVSVLVYGVVGVLSNAPYVTLDESHRGSPDYCDRGLFLVAVVFYGGVGFAMGMGAVAYVLIALHASPVGNRDKRQDQES